MAALSVKGLAGRPAGIDEGKAVQTPLGRSHKPFAVPGGIGGQGRAQAEQKQAVVGCGAGGAADAAEALAALRFNDAPVIGLLGPHRPAIDQGRRLHRKYLFQQTALGMHVVDVTCGPAAVGKLPFGVAGAAGVAVAKLAHHHQTPAGRVENGSHQPGLIVGPGAIGGGHQHQIAAIGPQAAHGAITKLGLGQYGAAGQFEIAQLKPLLVTASHRHTSSFRTEAELVGLPQK